MSDMKIVKHVSFLVLAQDATRRRNLQFMEAK